MLAELRRNAITATSPCAAVARIEATAPPDPTYALQVLPHAVEVQGVSIKMLADGAAKAIDAELLSAAPRGALTTHVLVPDTLRGVPPAKAKLGRRCEAVADQLRHTLRGRFAAARHRRECDAVSDTPLVLQLLLLEPELLVISLAPSVRHRSGVGYWPVRLLGGFVDCSLDGDMPSSAYRKLLESFVLMHLQPRPGDQCVDLGACPGGWTAAIRRQCDATVTAVDRSPLDPALDTDAAVTFVQGDAFAFEPPGGAADWMVSDVAAYPERCVELIERWSARRWARRMVVTMKFTSEPDFDAIDEARRAAEANSYRFRAMHHFSNKNEVSLMLDALGS